MIVPSLVTKVWQMFAGAHLVALVRRLWPVLAGVCLGTWAGAGLMTDDGKWAVGLLGIALMLYAIVGTTAFAVTVTATKERWLGPLSGVATGLITAATGVFVIPVVPYLQALGLDKEDLVQAMGLAFSLSTVALAGNLAAAGQSAWCGHRPHSARWRWRGSAWGSARRCACGCGRRYSGFAFSSACSRWGSTLPCAPCFSADAG